MDETIDWLRSRPYYRDQIVTHRVDPARDGRFAAFDPELDDRLRTALESRGIDRLYGHQADAIEAIDRGEHVVVATPTASGKSLSYAVPAFERAMDHVGTTLYVAPQVALIADQHQSLRELAADLGFGSRVTVDRYTGRLSQSEKRQVRERQPTVLLTTPDMLHYGILPHAHRLWRWFFERLELVVVDEVHEFRGVFGSHVGLVFRRLARLCERFGSDPQFVCASATIGNPVEHATTVTGAAPESTTLVDDDASASGPTHWLLWNPPEYEDADTGNSTPASGFGSGRRRSSHTESKRLFVDLVTRGLQTVVFTRSRQGAERYATESARELRGRGETALASSVTAYQAALRRDRRDEIEAGLRDGSIRGVWSTTALALGIDVGGLDAIVLDGYPGTRMDTYQQAGRAGRGTDPSLVVLVAGEDQLDQYLVSDPDVLFDGEHERAIANPANDHLLPDHVAAGARENWLSIDDERHFGDPFPGVVSDLEAAGDLERRSTKSGLRWTYAGGGSPQHAFSIRSIGGRSITLLDARSNEAIASLPFEDGLRDAHRGAIYHHQGQTYEVVDLDLDTDTARLEPTWADYYTRTLHEKAIVVDEDLEEYTIGDREDAACRLARVTRHQQIVGFERRDASTGEPLGQTTLDLPETTHRTEALYFTVPPPLEERIREQDGSFDGAIHAAEHAMISLFPTLLLCDRRDIGGVSTPYHGHTGESTIFIYDGYPGGVGYVRDAVEDVDTLVARTHRMLEACPCADGCPACVQSPQCGNANEPLDKGLAIELLGAYIE